MQTWFDAQLDQKIFDGIYFIPRWSGVLPPAESAVGASNSALASIRQLTHSKWPREAAMCKGVSPSYIMTQKRKTKVMNINEWQSNSYKSSLVAKIKVDIKRRKRIIHVGLPLLIHSLIMFSYLVKRAFFRRNFQPYSNSIWFKSS